MTGNIITFILLGIGTYTDMKRKEISVRLLLCFAVVSVISNGWKMYGEGIGVVIQVLIGMLPGLSLLVLARLTGESIGYGDGYLVSTLGSYLGVYRIGRILLMALFLEAIVSIALLICKKARKGTELPFLPVLLLSYGVQIFV